MTHIFLYGAPGSGKTTLGKALASSLQLPFADLDEAVEQLSGMPVARLMAQRGEDGFRDAESRVLRELASGPASIIALGGGSLLRDENRTLAEASGTVICLAAGHAELLRRLQGESAGRPLLAGDLEARLAALLTARRAHYESFSLQVDANQPTDELVRQSQIAAGRFHLAAMGSCDIAMEPGAIDCIGATLRERGVSLGVLVTDWRVSGLYAPRVLATLRRSGIECALLVLPGGEACKTLDSVSQLWQGFLEANLDRRSTVISLGGGVVSDLAGFAASTFMRGIGWVCLPTTVLAMVDASVGGKTGFDLPQGKNLVGSFHAPQLVLADPLVLQSLPQAEFRAGMAEAVKHGIIADPQLFRACAGGLAAIQDHPVALLRRAVAVKVAVVESDPYEAGPRAALNLGHTVGHAIELVSGFSFSHGEAVAIGLVAESRLAERLGIARRGLSEEIAAVLMSLGLPVNIPRNLPRDQLVHAMHADKKKSCGLLRFALPVDIGRVQTGVAVSEPQDALED